MVWGEGAIRREADIATADNETGMNATMCSVSIMGQPQVTLACVATRHMYKSGLRQPQQLSLY